MARIFVSPLSWGLGHATRVIPIIREVLKHGHEVTIAACGRALELLRREFPACRFVGFEDYPVPFNASRFFLPKFIVTIPQVLRAIAAERKKAQEIFSQEKYDLILSDNRFGVYSEDAPSFFLSHQLKFSVPAFLKPFETATEFFNSHFHQHFERIIVPDNPPEIGGLSGKLCQSHRSVTQSRIYFAGILCSVHRMPVEEDIDFLLSISGPEPQRSVLEEILLTQVPTLPGRIVVLLGRPDEEWENNPDEHTTIRTHASRKEMESLMNRAKFIICRSGYTTMMEMAELEKRRALLIPTPGQTEQEYLSQYYMEQKWFYSKSQYKLNLRDDIETASVYRGFPAMAKSEENAKRLYAELFSPYLD